MRPDYSRPAPIDSRDPSDILTSTPSAHRDSLWLPEYILLRYFELRLRVSYVSIFPAPAVRRLIDSHRGARAIGSTRSLCSSKAHAISFQVPSSGLLGCVVTSVAMTVSTAGHRACTPQCRALSSACGSGPNYCKLQPFVDEQETTTS